jgi:hypothetical protein
MFLLSVLLISLSNSNNTGMIYVSCIYLFDKRNFLVSRLNSIKFVYFAVRPRWRRNDGTNTVVKAVTSQN